MPATDRRGLLRLLPGAALLAGGGLLFLARMLERMLERSLGGTLLVPVLLEEGLKGALFLGLFFARRLSRNRPVRGAAAAVPAADLLPLLGIMGFGVAENILYFLATPTSSIYQRLLIAYPVHLNTGLLYTLALLSGRPFVGALAGLLGSAYHLGVNALVLSGPAPAVWAAGAVNLLALLLLIARLRQRRLERSLDACWNSG